MTSTFFLLCIEHSYMHVLYGRRLYFIPRACLRFMQYADKAARAASMLHRGKVGLGDRKYVDSGATYPGPVDHRTSTFISIYFARLRSFLHTSARPHGSCEFILILT